MSSLIIRMLLVNASIAFVMAGLPDWCDPHPPIPGATIMPRGRVREGQAVRIVCPMPNPNAKRSTFKLYDYCINGQYRPGYKSCDVYNNPGQQQ